MSQFATYIDAEGNLWMNAGTVQCFHAATTTVFKVGGGARAVIPLPGSSSALQPVPGGGTSLQGGSGRNAVVSGGPAGTLVPEGIFKPTTPNEWKGPRGSTLTFDPGDGSGELHDGTDVLAELAPSSATVAPYGTFDSTAYGDALNGATPFTVTVTYEGAATAFPAMDAVFTIYSGTAQGGRYSRTGWQSWESTVDATWDLVLDDDGAGILSDALFPVATRAADASKPYDPSGMWIATDYGRGEYFDGEAWAGDVVLTAAFPVAGFLYLELTVDGSNEVTAVAGPFFAATYPGNSATLRVVLIAESDGAGGIDPIQEGPIYWES